MRVGVNHLILLVAMVTVVGGCNLDEAATGAPERSPSVASPIGATAISSDLGTTGPVPGAVDSAAVAAATSPSSGVPSDAVERGDLDGVPVSASPVLCDELPTVPTFTVGGAEDLDAGGWSVEGEVGSLNIDVSRLELNLSAGPRAVDLAIENSGVAAIDLNVGDTVMVDYWRSQGFEGEARAIRVSDQAGVVMLVEDGEYGNALPPNSLDPFAVGQTDIGCRNRSNTPGSLNNFALTIEAERAAVVLMPGQSAIISVDGNDYAARNLRSVSRPSGVQWTEAPYSHTSFSIVRLPT